MINLKYVFKDLSLCSVVRPKWFYRLKLIIRNLATKLYNSAVSLNIFLLRNFGSNVDRSTAKRLGQWATRLYIVLYIICLSTLALYTVIQPQVLTKTFNQPPLDVYNRLLDNYGNRLKCTCSLVASAYNQSLTIEPVFHEVRKHYANLSKTKGEVEMMLLRKDVYFVYSSCVAYCTSMKKVTSPIVALYKIDYMNYVNDTISDSECIRITLLWLKGQNVEM